ncbi:MAG TPA: LUD domain-containing protein [Chitinophagales bacterium]|nr:LUD domain-containing protein [Chitinophagales bacterium]
MFTEESGTGFFAKMKSVFSAAEKSNNEETNTDTIAASTEETTGFTGLKATVVNLAEETTTTFVEPVLTYTSRVSDESVTEKEIPLRTVEVTAPTYNLTVEKDLDIRFATKFIQSNGKFVFCESIKEAVEGLRMLKAERNWSHIFCWENEIKDAFCDSNFQKGSIGYTIENSDAAISLCESLIAEEGTIILNPKQASRRRLHCFPKTHIIITDIAHLAISEGEGLERFYALNKGELPSIIKLGSCNNGHFYDKQRLILNAEGTEDVYVFLVDQIIPPSLRP